MAAHLYDIASLKNIAKVYAGLNHNKRTHAAVHSQVLAIHVSSLLIKSGFNKCSLNHCMARSKGSLQLICSLAAFSLTFATHHVA